MLILTRKLGETINIGGDIRITILDMKGNSVRIGIQAPKTISVYRGEIYDLILEQNRQAASPNIVAGDVMAYLRKETET